MSALYLTPQQVAERWGFSDEHVQRLCRRGELRAMRSGRSWRISLDAVTAYETRHTNEPEAAPEMAPALEAPRRATSVGGIELPADYEPVFGHLWATGGVAQKSRSRG